MQNYKIAARLLEQASRDHDSETKTATAVVALGHAVLAVADCLRDLAGGQPPRRADENPPRAG